VPEHQGGETTVLPCRIAQATSEVGAPQQQRQQIDEIANFGAMQQRTELVDEDLVFGVDADGRLPGLCLLRR